MKRREFLKVIGGAGVTLGSSRPADAAKLTRANLCFITDEVSRNLRIALQFAAEYGVRQVELRNVDNKYCFRHETEKLKEIRALLKEYGVHVAVLSTPILKCVLPGSSLAAGVRKEVQEAQKDFPIPVEQQFAQQMDFLRKAIEAARILETDKLRIFSYWRVEDRRKEQSRILEGLRRVTEVAEKEKIKLCIENEPGCNLADCVETAAALKEISSPNLGMAWDVVNGASTGETPYPNGFRLLDKKRIWHMHIKDSRRNPETGGRQICAVGDGDMPYGDIFAAMGKAGYTGALSMETHFSIDGSEKRLAGVPWKACSKYWHKALLAIPGPFVFCRLWIFPADTNISLAADARFDYTYFFFGVLDPGRLCMTSGFKLIDQLSPHREAAFFYALFLRGHRVESLRRDIDVPDDLFAKWMRASDFEPPFRESLQRMYDYRKRVLAIFDSLIASESMTTRMQ